MSPLSVAEILWANLAVRVLSSSLPVQPEAIDVRTCHGIVWVMSRVCNLLGQPWTARAQSAWKETGDLQTVYNSQKLG